MVVVFLCLFVCLLFFDEKLKNQKSRFVRFHAADVKMEQFLPEDSTLQKKLYGTTEDVRKIFCFTTSAAKNYLAHLP